GRSSADTKILLEQEEPTELVEDPSSGEKGEKEISTAEKKTKKQLEKERLGYEEAIRLQEHINKEKRQRIARDAEIAKQLQKEIDIARQEQEKYDLAQALELQNELDKRKEGVAETTQAHDIDWSNHGGYKQTHFKGMSYEDIRPIFEKGWDQNQSFVPKDSEIEKEVMKRSRFNFQKPPAKRQKVGEVSGIIRVGNHTEVYQVFEDMLKRFDRDDLEKLWDLVKKKFSSTEPTINKEKVLWVELKRLFEPDDDDTLWKLQRYMHDPLKWKLYDTCGVHHVSTERGHDIFMLVKKDYLLTRAIMTVMLANKL
ncbi:hypothetical protein Tco_0305058, partial [Tanacetum coccineum]